MPACADEGHALRHERLPLPGVRIGADTATGMPTLFASWACSRLISGNEASAFGRARRKLAPPASTARMSVWDLR